MSIEMFKEQFRAALRLVLGPPLSLGVRLLYGHADTTLPPRSAGPPSRHSMPIDIVYTWVDDADPAWRKKLEKYRGTASPTKETSHSTRYHNRQELRFSLRSVARYAPFVRTIHIVTDGQTPEWLNTGHPRIHMVSHREIFPSLAYLPNFNSHAIEANLHHIPGLAEHYVYMNDDVFLGQPVAPTDFFLDENTPIAHLSPHRVSPSTSGNRRSTLDLAYANNGKLLASVFKRDIEFKLAHVPHSQLRSVLFEIEERFKSEFKETSGHRFRSPKDISVTSCLFPYYAYFSERGVLRTAGEGPKVAYINVASPFLAPVLQKILTTRKYKFFCINEPISTVANTDKFDRVVVEFLERYYPDRSDFELAP